MNNKRQSELINEFPPCDTNYFDRTLLTPLNRVIKDGHICPNVESCETAGFPCALKYGKEVAKIVSRRGDLKEQLMMFSQVPFLDAEFWDSKDGKTFRSFQGKALMLRAIECFARVVLLEDTSKSVLETCGKCGGSKIEKKVIDSIHDSPIPLAGSGRTRSRIVEYCLDCDHEPHGRIIDEYSMRKKRFKIIRKFKEDD